MNTTSFGRTGLNVSRLGFGGAPIGYLKAEQERVERILNFMLDSGVNLIDTAASYPGSEEMIGKAIAGRRDQLILVSKCGSQVPGTTGAAWSADLIRQTVDRALKNLRTDRLDVMLLHSCDLATLKKGEAIGALAEARAAGKVRFPGYSGDNEAAAWAAEHPDVFVIETSVNIADQANIERVLPVTKRARCGVLAKRPIANAAWRDPSQQAGIYVAYAQTYHDRLRSMKVRPQDLGFAGESEWPEIALRFTHGFEDVHCAIVGTTNPDNARRNFEFVQKGPLPPAAVEKLRQAFREAEAASGTRWEAQT